MIVFCGYSHILINITGYCIAKRLFDFNMKHKPIVIIFCIILGSILADIDHSKSTINKYLIFPFYILFDGNRTLPHTIIGALLFSLPICIYNLSIGVIFFFSYIGHLLIDTLTPMGIMWLYPTSKRYYSLNLNVELLVVGLSFTILTKGEMWKYLIH